MQSVPMTLLTLFTALGACATFGIFVGSTMYDVREIRRKRPLRQTPHAKRFTRRPLVSVVILAHNDETSITDTLQSIFTSGYKKIEVIIMDNASTDQTLHMCQDFAGRYPKRSIRTLRKRMKLHDSLGLKKHAWRYTKGEFVFFIDGKTRLLPNTILYAVKRFLVEPELVAIAPRVVRPLSYHITSHAQLLADAINGRLQKTVQLLANRQTPKNNFYRKQSGLRLAEVAARYAADVMIETRAVTWLKMQWLARTAIWLMWLIVGAVIGYAWYLAITRDVLEPVGLIWACSTMIGLLFVTTEDRITLGQKIRSLMLLPSWYLLVCIRVLVGVLSPLRILRRIRVNVSIRFVESQA